MTAARPVLWKHNFAMRMLRWLMIEGETTQTAFIKEYKRIGATSGSYTDDFHRYTRHRDSDDVRRVIFRTVISTRNKRLQWCGPTLESWLAATSDAELQLGFETMERAWLETHDDHFRDWVARLRAEIERRST